MICGEVESTSPVPASKRVTVPSRMLSVQTEPSATAIAMGRLPVGIGEPTTSPDSASMRLTVSSNAFATHTVSPELARPPARRRRRSGRPRCHRTRDPAGRPCCLRRARPRSHRRQPRPRRERPRTRAPSPRAKLSTPFRSLRRLRNPRGGHSGRRDDRDEQHRPRPRSHGSLLPCDSAPSSASRSMSSASATRSTGIAARLLASSTSCGDDVS